MSAPDPKAVEAGISWLTSQKTRWGDLRQHQAVTIADALIAAARAYLRAPTAPQGAEIARDLLAENEKLKRGIVSLQKKLDAARGNLQQRQRAGEKRNKRAALTPTDAETKKP